MFDLDAALFHNFMYTCFDSFAENLQKGSLGKTESLGVEETAV